METIIISSLNQYAYCPKRAWYALVAGERGENEHLVAGALLHKRADSAEPSAPRRGVKQRRTVTLYSHQYGLSGIADLVEEAHGEIYPVEYKKGALGDWLNDQIQLCAQALCLEEMLRLKAPIRRGFLYYAANRQRQEIRFTEKLRTQTRDTITAVRTMLRTKTCPVVVYRDKCPGCSVYRICLPKETEQLRKR